MTLHLLSIRRHHPPLWRRIDLGMAIAAVIAASAAFVAVAGLSG